MVLVVAHMILSTSSDPSESQSFIGNPQLHIVQAIHPVLEPIGSFGLYVADVLQDIKTAVAPVPTYDPIPQNVANANNAFAIEFYRQISDNDENQFFSPASIYTAFSMLYEGARNNSATQLKDTFGFEPDSTTRTTETSQMISSINREDPDTTLDIANALWPDKRHSVLSSYEEAIRQTYVADVKSVSFPSDYDVINQWASDKTHGKIPKVVEEGELIGAVMADKCGIFQGDMGDPV